MPDGEINEHVTVVKMEKGIRDYFLSQKLPTKFKGKFNHAVICPTILYGSVYLALKGQEKKGAAKMSMLR